VAAWPEEGQLVDASGELVAVGEAPHAGGQVGSGDGAWSTHTAASLGCGSLISFLLSYV